MPNYCFNAIEIVGTPEQIEDIDKRRVGHSAWGGDDSNEFEFHQFVPVPDDVLRVGYNGENRAEDGSDDHILRGYDWECANWGVKWGFIENPVILKRGTMLVILGDTPWSPPIEFFQKLSGQYEKLQIRIRYSEPGMAFAGETRVEGGVITFSEEYDYSDEFYDEIKGIT